MRYFLSFLALIALASCSRDFDIVLPENDPQLVVECYLEDGMPLRALVSESTALLDTTLVPPIVSDAIVTITHGGRVDTLRPSIYVDPVRNRAYNYGNSSLVRADYNSGESYRIDVTDSKGRHTSGITQFIRPAYITSLEMIYRNDSEASCMTSIADDPAMKNYYQLVLKRNSRTDSIQQNFIIGDDLVNRQNTIVIRSAYRFHPGDSLYATLYHLTKDYYQFLNTTQSARSALGNPFAASGEVVSNISGGLGVFAALTFTEQGIRVER